MTWAYQQLLRWVSLIRRILNMACFYGGWFVCMHEATGPNPLVGPLVVAALLVYHMIVTDSFWVDAALIVTLSVVGTFVDSAYVAAGLVTYQGGYACCPGVAPLWITALWALYASSVNHSLDWLKWHYILVAAPLGAGGAISSYLVGAKLGAAEFHYPPLIAYGVIGAVWAFVVPLSLIYSDWLKRKITLWS